MADADWRKGRAAAYAARSEINWDRLDKTKFLTMGLGIFTSVTVALYPFSVIKTRMQVSSPVSLATSSSSPSSSSSSSRHVRHLTAMEVVRQIARNEGPLGFYRGFGTVILGMMPMRFIYMAVLEVTKAGTIQTLQYARDGPTRPHPHSHQQLKHQQQQGQEHLHPSLASSSPSQPAMIPSPKNSRSSETMVEAEGGERRQAPGSVMGEGRGRGSEGGGLLSGLRGMDLSDDAIASIASGVGGMCASMMSQMAIVPVDVIASRLIAQHDTTGLANTHPEPSGVVRSTSTHTPITNTNNTGAQQHPRQPPSPSPSHAPLRYRGGWDALRSILTTEGLPGLYRGFSLSLLTYVPSGFVWWASYSASQRMFWNYYFRDGPESSTLGISEHPGPPPPLSPPLSSSPPLSLVVAVQAGGGVCAGLTAAAVTTPLDTLKTRVQVQRRHGGASQGGGGVSSVFRQLVREEGLAALYRGLGPRSASMALWGTAMVTSYEFLKRLCVKDEP